MMAWVPALRSALRGTPHFDAELALIAFAALLIDPLASHQVTSLTPLDGGLALVTAVPLVLRRRYPLGVLVAIVPLLLACLAVFHPDHAAAGIVMVVVFPVGLHGHRARALAVGALMAPVVAAGVLITSHQLGGDSVAETVAYLALVLGALVAGGAVRARRRARAARRRRARPGGDQRAGRGRRSPGAPGAGSQPGQRARGDRVDVGRGAGRAARRVEGPAER